MENNAGFHGAAPNDEEYKKSYGRITIGGMDNGKEIN